MQRHQDCIRLSISEEKTRAIVDCIVIGRYCVLLNLGIALIVPILKIEGICSIVQYILRRIDKRFFYVYLFFS